MQQGDGGSKGVDGTNEVAVIEVPGVEGECGWEAAEERLNSEREKEGTQGVALLDALLGGKAGGATEEGCMGPIGKVGPASEVRGEVVDGGQHGGAVDGIESIGTIDL